MREHQCLAGSLHKWEAPLALAMGGRDGKTDEHYEFCNLDV